MASAVKGEGATADILLARGRRRERPLERRDGFIRLAAIQKGVAKRGQDRAGDARAFAELERASILAERFVKFAEPVSDHGQAGTGLGIARVERDKPPVGLLGLAELLRLAQRHREVVQDPGVVGIEVARLSIRIGRLVGPLRRRQHVTELEQIGAVARIEIEGAPQARLGVVETPDGVERQRSVSVVARLVRVQRYRPGEAFQRRAMIALLVRHHAPEVPGVGVIGDRGENLFVELAGARHIARSMRSGRRREHTAEIDAVLLHLAPPREAPRAPDMTFVMVREAS